MATAVAARAPADGGAIENTPWTLRLAEAFPGGAVGVGLAILVVHTIGLAAVLAFQPGELTSDSWGMASSNTLLNLLAGYSVAAMGYGRRAHALVLDRLRGVLELDDDGFAAERARALAFHGPLLRYGGLFTAAGIGLLMLLDPFDMGPFPRPDWVQPMLYWVIWTNVLMTWLFTRFVLQELASLVALSRLAARYARVDLWDQRPLAPFTRRGLQSVLALMLGMSLLMGQILGGWASALVPIVLVALVAQALVQFLLPAVGVHRRIRATKWARIEELNARARILEGALGGDDADARRDAAVELPAVLSLRDAVQRASEWPIDLPAITRLVLYIAIGLGSWLGAALVERGLESWLGSG